MSEAPSPGPEPGPGLESTPDPRERSIFVRAVFLVLGLLFVVLGLIGVFLPLLPTVPFLILAAACFGRSSRRLETWLLTHRHLGPPLRAWRERGAIPPRAKALAVIGMALGFASFLVFASPALPLLLAVGLVIGVGAAFVLTRPGA